MAFYGRKLSIKGVNVAQATDKQLILKEDYDAGNTLYYDINGNPNVLLGNRPKNNSNGINLQQQGLFVSKPGINVLNANNNQLVFNSNQNIFKIAISGTTTVTKLANQTLGLVTINHNLGYRPAVLAYADYLGANSLMPYSLFNSSTGTVSIQFYAYADSASLNIVIFTPSNAGSNYSTDQTATFRYYLMQETAS